eukprot:1351604-Alexandrium_andersonii.AAC.1
MSASLVGSEMCIRDRRATCAAPTLLRSASWAGGFQTPACASTWTCSAPVSYTHLTLPTICSV